MINKLAKLAYRYCDTLLSCLMVAFTGDRGSMVSITKVGQYDGWMVGPCMSVICGDSGTDVGQNESWDTSSVRQAFIKTSCSPQCTICCACEAQREPMSCTHTYFTHRSKNNYTEGTKSQLCYSLLKETIILSQSRKCYIYNSTTRIIVSLCIKIITRQGQAVTPVIESQSPERRWRAAVEGVP